MADDKQPEGRREVVLEDVLELNFVPDWARKPPQPNRWADERRSPRTVDRDRRRGDKGSGRRPPRRREDKRHDRRDGRRMRREKRGGQSERPVSRSDERRRSRGGRSGPSPRAPREPRLPLEMRIIPSQAGIQAIARRIHHSAMAYPIMELAGIFLSRPELTRVRLEVAKNARDVTLYQCQACGAVARDEERAQTHLVAAHLEEYFAKEEKRGDPPSGSFVCVARCGLSGEILGPPNHHSYARRIQEVHDRCCPDMDIDAYRRRIETIREEAVIEQWKEQARKQTVYRPRESASGEVPRELTYDEAVAEFRRSRMEGLLRKARRASVPAKVALYLDDVDIRSRARRLWEEEERFPLKVSFALRAAFKHMHLHVFKAGKGIHFVTHVAPAALDPDHVVQEIREVLLYLHDHPGSSRAKLVEQLRPGNTMNSDRGHEVLAPLSWLIEKGHIIEFFNGTLAVPMQQQTSRNQKSEGRRNRHKGGRDA